MSEMLTAGTVARISFDYGIELLLQEGAIARIEGEGVLAVDSHSVDFDAEKPKDIAPLILELLNQQVVITNAGSAMVVESAAGETLLTVGSSEDYEAWSLVLEDGSRVVCPPGGELSRFGHFGE